MPLKTPNERAVMNQKSITLTNLTTEQVEMLEILWSLADFSEVEEFQATLSDQEREMSETLMRLIILETVDEILANDVSDACEYLKKFQL
jgi:hypothetical protein